MIILSFVDTFPQNIQDLQHIANVLEERVLLYKKRKTETKRALKAISRLNQIPDNNVLEIILEAEIQYEVNLAGKLALDKIISDLEDGKKIDSVKEKIKNQFIENLLLRNTIDSSSILANKEKHYTLLFDMIFTLDEDFQRSKIQLIISNYAEDLIEKIFNEIVILDMIYRNKVITEFKSSLTKRNP